MQLDRKYSEKNEKDEEQLERIDINECDKKRGITNANRVIVKQMKRQRK